MKLLYFKLKNFKFLEHNGLNEFEFSRYDSKNNIILINGRNGSGKSSIMQELTPLPIENTNNRNISRISDDKEGEKILEYEHNGFYYKCKIIYGKKTSCYFYKKSPNDDEYVELNPNGNVSSYIETVKEELDMDKDYYKTGHISNSITNFVNMKPSDRYNYISNWLPNISMYVEGYKVVHKKYTLKKKEVNNINLEIGKIEAIDYEIEIDSIKKSIQSIHEDNDIIKNKLSLSNNHFNQLSIFSNHYSKLNSYKSNLIENYKIVKDNKRILFEKIEEINKYNNKDFLLSEIEKTNKLLIDKEIAFNKIDNEIDRLNFEIDSKIEKEDKEFNSDKSLDELKNLLKSSEGHLEKLKKDNLDLEKDSKYIIDKGITKDLNKLYKFIEIANYLTRSFETIGLHSFNSLEELNVKLDDHIKENESIDRNIEKYTKLKQDVLLEIKTLENGSEMQNIIKKKPANCTPNDCAILKHLERFINVEKEIKNNEKIVNSYTSIIEESEKRKNNLVENMNLVMKEINCIKEVNSYLMKNKSEIMQLDPYIVSIFSNENIKDIMSELNKIYQKVDTYKDYLISFNNISEEEKQILQLKENINRLVVKFDIETLTKEVDEKTISRDSLKQELVNIQNKINVLSNIEEQKASIDKTFTTINDQIKLLDQEYEFIERINEYNYLFDGMKKVIIDLENKKTLNNNKIKDLESQKEKLSNSYNSKLHLEEIRNNLLSEMKKYEILCRIWSTKTGYPSLLINDFLYMLKEETNNDLKRFWSNTLTIEDINLDNSEFSISINVNDTVVPDIGMCSEGERSTLALAINFAIINMNLTDKKYNLMRLDEIDASLDDTRRQGFLKVLLNKVEELNNDTFVISHNNYFDDINADMILLDNVNDHNVKENKNLIYHI